MTAIYMRGKKEAKQKKEDGNFICLNVGNFRLIVKLHAPETTLNLLSRKRVNFMTNS